MINKITKGIGSLFSKIATALNPEPVREVTKYEILATLLQKYPIVSVLVDTSKEGIILPSYLLKQESVTLQYGLGLASPILDFAMGQDGIKATLSFNRKPSYTFIPWEAVLAIVPGNPPPIGPTSGTPNLIVLKGGKYEEVKEVANHAVNNESRRAA